MTALPIIEAFDDEPPVPRMVRTLGTIGRLLSYPDQNYLPLAELLYVLVQDDLPEAAKSVSQFGQLLEQFDVEELEELYTRSFDLNPACSLEIGWHLFGEDYMRGQFLVRMRGLLREYNLPESTDLPDHLSHVLAVISAMPVEEASRFAQACVFPALHKLRTGLSHGESPYRHLIDCLILLLEQDYGSSEPWGDNDEKLLRNMDAFPGQNGLRPPGASDPLRSYPRPDSPCYCEQELIPLETATLSSPNVPEELNDIPGGR